MERCERSISLKDCKNFALANLDDDDRPSIANQQRIYEKGPRWPTPADSIGTRPMLTTTIDDLDDEDNDNKGRTLYDDTENMPWPYFIRLLVSPIYTFSKLIKTNPLF